MTILDTLTKISQTKSVQVHLLPLCARLTLSPSLHLLRPWLKIHCWGINNMVHIFWKLGNSKFPHFPPIASPRLHCFTSSPIHDRAPHHRLTSCSQSWYHQTSIQRLDIQIPPIQTYPSVLSRIHFLSPISEWSRNVQVWTWVRTGFKSFEGFEW